MDSMSTQHRMSAQPQSATAPQAPAKAEIPPGILDFSRMEAPRNLEQVRLEELTIDGICGVY